MYQIIEIFLFSTKDVLVHAMRSLFVTISPAQIWYLCLRNVLVPSPAAGKEKMIGRVCVQLIILYSSSMNT